MKSLIRFALLFLLTTPVYAKHEQMPLPQQVMTAKTIYIDNQSGIAKLGDRAYDELRKWGRYQIVDSPEKADLVFLLSAKEFISGYTNNSYSHGSGSVDNNGNFNGNAYGSSSSHAEYRGTTYLTLVDPKTGNSLWSDARNWGYHFKSATKGLVQELEERVAKQERKK